MAGSPPNFHKMDSRSACIQGVLKVKVKVKGNVIRVLSWILGMSYSVIDGLVCLSVEIVHFLLGRITHSLFETLPFFSISGLFIFLSPFPPCYIVSSSSTSSSRLLSLISFQFQVVPAGCVSCPCRSQSVTSLVICRHACVCNDSTPCTDVKH